MPASDEKSIKLVVCLIFQRQDDWSIIYPILAAMSAVNITTLHHQPQQNHCCTILTRRQLALALALAPMVPMLWKSLQHRTAKLT
jgi:hypothetical protein